jgi:hypothetical protein
MLAAMGRAAFADRARRELPAALARLGQDSQPA